MAATASTPPTPPAPPIPPAASSPPSAATIASIGPQVAAALAAADGVAAGNVQTVSLVHKARLAQLTRTAARLSAQSGPNSSQAVAARAAVTRQTAVVSRIAMVGQQVSTPAPQVAAAGWALHGRVYTADSQPAAAYCVFLVDAEKAYQGAYGFSYTDPTGYFLINFAGTTAAAETTKARAPAEPAQLFVEVADPNGLPVLIATTPFQPTSGAATYQRIGLPAGGKPLGDPPAEIRKVALPPASGKKAD